MRLKSIKLAGFKSFVDPTTVSLPSNLCAVVGPNGCGKSNIIDAVRWVMGESSAKNLRGEHMTDVIFNGSSNRKPVGQASVELVFDNTDRTIKGEYASYNEIAVRRTVTADAQSTYYLNGSKCRRRDITDIFLGTGLGPRSYSIIEQGMVSRLIESKPEELRVFIEEAAGISKYKERRRETENRIRRTKENLERLTDIREELDRQLQHLQRQAKAAEKYREYKQQERDLSARLNALRWRDLDSQVRSGEQDIARLDVSLEGSNAQFRKLEAEIEQLREDNHEVNEHYQEVQAQFYSLGGEISRIEQSIEHQRQRKQQLEEDLRMTDESLETARQQLQEDQDRIAGLDEELLMVEPELEDAKMQEEESLQAQESAEEVMGNWQQQWDEFNSRSATATKNAEVERQRIEHLENIVARGQQRRQTLETEKQGLSAGPEETEIGEIEEKIEALTLQQEELEGRNEEVNERLDQTRQNLKASTGTLNETRNSLQSLLGRRASLEALQQAALGDKQGDVVQWLEANQLVGQARLVDDLRVDSGWETAVETVLGRHLQALCVNDLTSLSQALNEFEAGELSLLDTSVDIQRGPANEALSGRELMGKISSSRNLNGLLDGIYYAESLDEALELRGSLRGCESIITVQGIWLGPGWLRLARGFDEKAGMIQRQEEIDTLAEQVSEQEEQVAELSSRQEQEQQQLASLEQEKEEFLQQLNGINRALTDAGAERSGKLMKMEQVSERRHRLGIEIADIEKQLSVEQENIARARTQLQDALDAMEQDTARREELLSNRDEYRGVLDQSRQQARHAREHSHQLALRHQNLVTQLSSLKSALERMTSQVRNQELRHAQLEENLRQTGDPIPALQDELEEKLALRVEIEARLNESKARVDAIDHESRELERQRSEAQNTSQHLRDELASRRLSIEGATVKRETLAQTLREDSYDLDTVLENLPEEMTEALCEQELQSIAGRIQRLGAINLAAIDEYTTQSERKVYLDAQNDDLEKALTTLENAIRKIDKETRARFKETFDQINQGLQDLFPKVFGGGHAYLDMIGEDLLDTGVAIMARPPGKRNSTIHLLSGGEKAMTAIALVFAIFKLNPSPFCMLDEVDAPLDDANVGRYSRLVKEMSDVVQFIFITHNRITMEMSNQLLGVTMHEPGVSRLVAVDVEEAAELAAM